MLESRKTVERFMETNIEFEIKHFQIRGGKA